MTTRGLKNDEPLMVGWVISDMLIKDMDKKGKAMIRSSLAQLYQESRNPDETMGMSKWFVEWKMK